MEAQTNNTAETTQTSNENTMAIIAYITIIGLIIAFISNQEKKDTFVKYHIVQSLGLALTGLALGVISMIPILGWIIYIVGIFVLLYMWIMGLMNAINKKAQPVPFIGEKYREWFKNL
jgi:uncharacterized membrane protein